MHTCPCGLLRRGFRLLIEKNKDGALLASVTQAHSIRPFAFYFQDLYSAQHVLPYSAGKSTGLSSLPGKSDVVGENLECRETFLLLESFLCSVYHYLNTENSLTLVRFAQDELCLCKMLLWLLGL